MKIYSPITLRLSDNQLFAAGYTMPEPDKMSFEYSDQSSGHYLYISDHKTWLASKIELEVSEESKDALEDAIFPIGRRIMEKEDITWSQCKERGFDISALAGRIQVESEKCCAIACDWPECKMPSCYGNKRITLLPEKEEGQDDRADLETEFYVRFGNKLDADLYDEIFGFIEKFTITKKK